MDKFRKEIEDRMALTRENYQGPHCCFDMDSMLQNDDIHYNIYYDPAIREYYLKSLEGYIRPIEFCSWCGTQLMKNLSDEWYNILEAEYGLDMPQTLKQKKKIPAEFFTDEWWKKRNL